MITARGFATAGPRLGGAPAAGAGSAAKAENEKLREVAREFEAVFIGMLLKQARSATRAMSDEKPSFGRETYEGWQDEELARCMALGQGIGIGEMLYRQLLQQQLQTETK